MITDSIGRCCRLAYWPIPSARLTATRNFWLPDRKATLIGFSPVPRLYASSSSALAEAPSPLASPTSRRYSCPPDSRSSTALAYSTTCRSAWRTRYSWRRSRPSSSASSRVLAVPARRQPLERGGDPAPGGVLHHLLLLQPAVDLAQLLLGLVALVRQVLQLALDLLELHPVGVQGAVQRLLLHLQPGVLGP